MTTCQICGARTNGSTCTNSLCRAFGKPIATRPGRREFNKSEAPSVQPIDLERKLVRRAKSARHEALFPIALLLLNLFLLRGIGLPLGGLLVALSSLYRISRIRRTIRDSRVGESLLPKLSVTVAIGSVSAALSILAIALNLMYIK